MCVQSDTKHADETERQTTLLKYAHTRPLVLNSYCGRAAGYRGAPCASLIGGHGLGGRQALAEHGTRGKVKNEARWPDEIRE